MDSSNARHDESDRDSGPEMLAEEDVEEIVDDDVAMDSDGAAEDDDAEAEEITLHNDSVAYFDGHKDSVFAVAQHPLFPSLVATGGSEGDADDAPGKAYVLYIPPREERQGPVLPPSYAADAGRHHNTDESGPNRSLRPVFAIDGHADSVTALAFSQPHGDVLFSAGMDGRLRAYVVTVTAGAEAEASFELVGEAQETDEVAWLAACPCSTDEPNAVALGAGDGSVWVYAADAAGGLRMVASYFPHTGACTAGAWTPDGAFLATVTADGSLHVFDVWSFKALGQQTVFSLTQADARFAVEGGLYSVAVAPSGAFLAAGGIGRNGGVIHVVGLPKTGRQQQQQQRHAAPTTTQPGAILASLVAVQTESVESLSFSPGPGTLLAAGSVDGSIAVFDTVRQFAKRRHLRGAHEDHSVVRVEFVPAAPDPTAAGWLLTSCGLDGVVRRWDLRAGAAGTAATGDALVKEWRGHRGGGEGGGVLAFVQGDTGERVVTAGDDGLVLVFDV